MSMVKKKAFAPSEWSFFGFINVYKYCSCNINLKHVLQSTVFLTTLLRLLNRLHLFVEICFII